MKKRELFADFTRFLSIIMVLFIHCTVNYMVSNFPNSSSKTILIISSLTCSAVPLFYMLSGCFLINSNNFDLKRTLSKVIKLYCQLLFWNLLYFIMFKFILNQDISIIKSLIKALFSSQISHFWFMYPLISLYVLLPFISKLYFNSNENEKKFLIFIILIIPLIINTFAVKYSNVFIVQEFSIFFPTLGLFVLGKYLYDNKEKFDNIYSIIISFLGIILGVFLTVKLAYFYINSNGINHIKPYFDYNKIPTVLTIVSSYIFMLSIGKYLNKLPNFIKKIIILVGSNTKGIYYIHMFFLYLIPSISIFNINISQNSGSLLGMMLSVFLYLILSIISILIIKKVPILKKTVD